KIGFMGQCPQRPHHFGQWQALPSGEYRSAVAKAVRIAKKQAAIDVLRLPIQSPEALQ
ncbi:MAG TPA: hypothetical protein DCF62_13420, partial [Porticoccaceae bacterium]|nr:hypothetical protein [Porticoccaceae bacterium]